MAKSINSFLPKYEPTIRCIQAEIGRELAEKVDRIRRRRKLTWAELVGGLFRKLVEDLGPPKAEPVRMPEPPPAMSEDEVRQMNMFVDQRMK